MSKVLLITGATGKQGGAVIDSLLALDPTGASFTILAVTRDTSSPAAQRLLNKIPPGHNNLRLVQADLDDAPGLFSAARLALGAATTSANPNAIWGVFSLQPSLGPGISSDREIAQGTSLIDCAISAGVRHFIYSSVERSGDDKSWSNPTPVPHFQTKYHIERHLRDATSPGRPGAGMGWTILRPVAFMDNLAPGFKTSVFLAAMRNHLDEDGKRLQWIATADIGVFAAKAFADPEGWDGKAVGLAGDELSFAQMSGAFEGATGSPAPAAHWFFGSALTKVAKELRLMLEWFADEGFKADIEGRRREHPGLLTMEAWLARKSGFVASEEE
ncbi:NmrA-like domain-containing protein [Madurella fahalii]|uniref:NmrA-like domain-containing protein n=1 Tax=Madurella fahalii TaxID=1157608 RepID=A0ABQ0GC81_9PEZI